jgi:hypothetical protein
MQWRGAATDHSIVGPESVWLCAAGTRRQGDSDEFCTAFTRDVARTGAEPWLPTSEDHLVAAIDEKILRLDAWKLQVHCGALALRSEVLTEPGETKTLRFLAPSRGGNAAAVGEFSLSSESVDIDGIELTEVFLSARILDRANTLAGDVAIQLVASFNVVYRIWVSVSSEMATVTA